MDSLEDIDMDLVTKMATSKEVEVNNSEPAHTESKVDRLEVALNSATVENKPSSFFQWNISNGTTVQSTSTTNSLFNTNFYLKYAERA